MLVHMLDVSSSTKNFTVFASDENHLDIGVLIKFHQSSVEFLSQFLTAHANVALADVAVGYQNVAATSDTMGSHQPK